MLREVLVLCFFSSFNSFIFLSKLSILVIISSNLFSYLFSRFLVSLCWFKICSFSSQKFLIIHLLKSNSFILSQSFSIQLCSLAGEEFWSFAGGEEFWFLVFSSLLRWFLPIFVDLSTCILSDCWFSDCVSEWTSRLLMMKYFCFLGFLLTVWPHCYRTAEIHSRPCLPWELL